MVSRTLINLALAACCAAFEPILLQRPGLLSFPIQRRAQNEPLLQRYSNNSDVTLYNQSGSDSYHIQLSIGTPSQNLTVQIDTGSDELWVNPNCDDSTLTELQVSDCKSFGFFNANSSSTLEQLGNGSGIQYALGSVEFDYVKDSISLPGSSIALTSVQFGIGTNSSETSEGVIGLGFGKDKNLNYSNFIDVLQEQGATKSQAFSIALGDANADNGGVIIFGGVDTKKFTGPLKQFEILGKQTSDDTYRYYINLDTVGVTNSDGSSTTYGNGSLATLVDSGATLCLLPAAILDNVAKDMGAKYDAGSDQYLIDCDQFNTAATVDFAFDGLKIQVPYSQFLSRNSATECIIGAQRSNMSAGPPYYRLGDAFMRSAYVIFDQSTPALWMAPSASCGKNEQEIPATGVGAANFTGECSVGSRNTGSGGGDKGEKSAAAGPGVSMWLTAAAGIVLVSLF